jgi:hypothetical protein
LGVLLLDAGPVELLKRDGFLAKTLIYVPSATIGRNKDIFQVYFYTGLKSFQGH